MREFTRKSAYLLAGLSVAATLTVASLPGAWAQADDAQTERQINDQAVRDFVPGGDTLLKTRDRVDALKAFFTSSPQPQYDANALTPPEADEQDGEPESAEETARRKAHDAEVRKREAARIDDNIRHQIAQAQVRDESARKRIQSWCTDPKNPSGDCLNALDDARHAKEMWDAIPAAARASYNQQNYEPVSAKAARQFLASVPSQPAPVSASAAPATPGPQPQQQAQQAAASDIAPPSSPDCAQERAAFIAETYAGRNYKEVEAGQYDASFDGFLDHANAADIRNAIANRQSAGEYPAKTRYDLCRLQNRLAMLEPQGAPSSQPSDGTVLTRGGDSANMVQATIQQSQQWEAGRGARDAAERQRQEALDRYYAERARERAQQEAAADRQYQQQNNADSAAFFNALGAFANAVGQAQQQRQQQKQQRSTHTPSSPSTSACYDAACTMVQ